MQIVIHTIQGTFIVPTEKQTDLIHWLQNNAIKTSGEAVREGFQQNTQPQAIRQLINEDIGREF